MAPRKTASYVPAVKPAIGIVVKLHGKPGTWQITSKAPERGTWWLTAMDAEAKAHSNFQQASAPDMTR